MYANNILPQDASYYTLYRASIVDGILNLQAGGYATYEITTDNLQTIPNSIRVSVIPNSLVDNYDPRLLVYITIVYEDDTERFITLTPTVGAGEVFTQDLELTGGTYKSFTFTIFSEDRITVPVWELCPEATDSALEVEIDGVKQSLPKLLYDYNALPITVQQLETTVGLITFNLKYATDLQGNVHLTYVASEDCVITLRVKDTGITELYTPILYDVRKGRGTIALPHTYLKRLTGLHSAYVTLQASIGTLTIPTRGLLYTIEGGYVADRELDAGMEVHDVAVCNTRGDTEPEDLWVVGISAGECLVKIRSYTSDPTIGFSPVFTVGSAQKASIEFNGYFDLNRTKGHERYTLITESVPYVFWIDLRGNLYRQYGNDENSKVLIDTNVSDVSACRGFSSTLMLEQDQGLIVLYVKRGVAKYVTYSYDVEYAGASYDPSSYTWQGPFTIPLEENVLNASVTRLNDYRVGITLTTPTSNWWYISERTYVTQTMEPATIAAGYNNTPRIAVFPVGSIPVLSVAATLDNIKKNITLVFSHDITQLYNDETFLPEEFTGVNVESISIVDSKTIVVHSRDTINSNRTLKYNSAGIIKFIFEPVANMQKPVTTFETLVTVPALSVDTVTDTIQIKYNSTPVITVTPVADTSNRMTDTINVSYASTVSIQPIKVSYAETSQQDTIVANYSTSANIVLTQVGTHPI